MSAAAAGSENVYGHWGNTVASGTRTYGYNAAERLNVHLMEMMKRRSQARAWVREDTE